MALAALAISCGSPAEPSPFAAITSVRFEPSVPFQITPDLRLEFEFWNCDAGPRVYPSTCLLTETGAGLFVCQDSAYLQFQHRVSTTCESSVDVRITTATGNPLMQTAHTIYVNGTKVTRFTSLDVSSGYSRESGLIAFDTAGHIH